MGSTSSRVTVTPVRGLPQHRRPRRQRTSTISTARPRARPPWPRFGQNQLLRRRRRRPATSRWPRPNGADKPYGFANFLRSGPLHQLALQRPGRLQEGQQRRRLQVRHLPGPALAEDRGRDVRHEGAGNDPRAQVRLRRPQSERVDQGRLLRPQRWRHLLLLAVPDQTRAKFGDEGKHAPAQATLDPTNGNVTKRLDPAAGDLPQHGGRPPPSWCPSTQSPEACALDNPFGLPSKVYTEAFPGQPRHGRSGEDLLPLGDARPGRPTSSSGPTRSPPPPFGTKGPARFGDGCTAASPTRPVYQLWISAVGLNPQDNTAFTATYPWLGIRVGVLGNLKPGK